MLVFPFFTSAVWPPHASPLFGVHLCFRVWSLCSPLSVVIYSFCSLSIRSKFQTKSWSTFCSSSPFGSRDRSVDPSVVNEKPTSLLRTLAMDTFPFSIIAFSRLASLGVLCFCLAKISTFALDGSLT